jgi:hypothetical protein
MVSDLWTLYTNGHGSAGLDLGEEVGVKTVV